MALIGGLRAELVFESPEGNLKLYVEQQGRVVLSGTEPMARTRWYRDRLRAMYSAVRFKRGPKGCRIRGTEAAVNKPFALKMIEAGLDIIRQYERPALAYDGPKANDVLRGIGSPYRIGGQRAKDRS